MVACYPSREQWMNDIRHRVGVAAPAGKVYQALATRDGLSEWWTRDVRGESAAGHKLEFFFGGTEPAAVTAYFLLTSRAGLQGGKATPFPDDEKISTWG